MGYFSNGAEGAAYQAEYCDKCWHDRDNTCPIWMMHLLWNSDAVGLQPDKTKAEALNTLIPISENGLYNLECKMFIPTASVDSSMYEFDLQRKKERKALEAWNAGKPIQGKES